MIRAGLGLGLMGLVACAAPGALDGPDADLPDAHVAMDAHLPDAEPADAAGPDAEPAPDANLLGFSPAEQALIASLAGPLELPPDPTNRVADDPAAAALGRTLFLGEALGPSFVHCTTCHIPEQGFTNTLTYDGFGGLRLRSVPALVTAAIQPWFFWDGRADTQWGQVVTPFEDPEEMASDRMYIARALAADPALRGPYEALFGPLPQALEGTALPERATPFPAASAALREAWATLDPADQRALSAVLANVGKAIAAFQRTLVHTEGPFDRFARALAAGDPGAADHLPPEAIEGLRLFIGPAGCLGCHHGPAFSDGAFHNLGQGPLPGEAHPDGRAGAIPRLLASEFNAAGPYSDAPEGERAARLAALAPQPGDVGAFRTPTLRDVARTGPWGHDGRYDTLEAMVRYKLAPDDAGPGARDPLLQPVALDEAQVAALLAFLRALDSDPLPRSLYDP